MKLYFDFETHSLLDDILAAVSPVRPVSLDDLQIFDASTQHHVKQLERMHSDWPQQDDVSAAGRAIPMTAILERPGRYAVDGTAVLLLSPDPDGTVGS